MTRLLYRLHRADLVVAGAGFAVLCVLLGVTGNVMADHYRQALTSCAATSSCSTLSESLFSGDGLLFDTVIATVAVPLLLGMFWGGPLVARESEGGTLDLIWTQGITRRRWAMTNISTLLAFAACWGAALSALVSWWMAPQNDLWGRLSPGRFDVQGFVPIAYALFAAALGIATGATIRRTLPAIVVTLVAFTAIRVVILTNLRAHLLPVATKLYPLRNDNLGDPPGSLVLRQTVASPAGVPANLPASCAHVSRGVRTYNIECVAVHGYRRLVSFQPPSRFWALQGIESAIFVLLATILVLIAYRQIIRCDA